MRIVSLLPSATDIVSALGAGHELVGVSHSCGQAWAHLPTLTSTWIDATASSAAIDAQVRNASTPLYQLDINKLAQLRPDVIVSQSLCDVCAVPSGDVAAAISALPGNPMLVDISPSTLPEVPQCFHQVGAALQRQREAQRLLSQWQDTFARYHQRHQDAGLRIAFLDWLDPPFAAGHWVPGLIQWLGAESVLCEPGKPSFRLTWADVDAACPDLVIAACCGLTQSRATLEGQSSPRSIRYLDGYELFSRPSPALMDSLMVLDKTITQFLGH